MKEKTLYDELSEERKQLQSEGRLPEWCSTLAWQMLKEKYLSVGETDLKMVFTRVAKRAASYLNDSKIWEDKFFNLLWKGWLSGSTPVICNMGTNKGCAVSCSGSYIEDSIYGFYNSLTEAAILTKNGFGTSAYLGDIRPRGAKILNMTGTADGVLPVFKQYIQMSRDVSQGSQRRGAFCGYLSIEHPDVPELMTFITKNPDDANIGWIIHKEFIEKLNSGDSYAIELYQKSLKLKMLTGKGYYLFIDKVNELSPKMYKDKGVKIKASNLCMEIALNSTPDNTFACVLSSMNLSKYDEWKDTDAIFDSTVFLDCVNEDLINVGKNIKGLEKVVKFAKEERALGLGALGFHTYLQDNMIPFESMDAHYKNMEIFELMQRESHRASIWLASEYGESDMCKGYGVRNTTTMAIAPNLSSAIIAGSVSQGIEPFYMNAFTQNTAAGKMERINPSLIPIMKVRDVYNNTTIKDIIDHFGSVQHVEWLSDDEKLVFKTAFEIDQVAILRLASSRQRYIDQAQSINLFFSANDDEGYISSVHKYAFLDPYIKGLYYIRSSNGANKHKDECLACHA